MLRYGLSALAILGLAPLAYLGGFFAFGELRWVDCRSQLGGQDSNRRQVLGVCFVEFVAGQPPVSAEVAPRDQRPITDMDDRWKSINHRLDACCALARLDFFQ